MIEGWEVLDILTGLVERSLVVQDIQPVETRLRLLETVRQYAQEKLAASGEAETLRRRHAHYYLELAEEAESGLQGPEQKMWLDRLEMEHDNFRAAVISCGPEEKDAERGLRVVGALHRFWMMRGHFTEGRFLLDTALKRTCVEDRTPSRAKALHGAGLLAYWQSEYALSRRLHEQSRDIYLETGDKPGLAACLNSLATALIGPDNAPERRAMLEESLALYTELGNAWGIANVRHNLAGEWLAIDPAHARMMYEQALAERRALGDQWGIAKSLSCLGDSHTRKGEFAVAATMIEEALDIQRGLGDKSGVLISLGSLGYLAWDQNLDARARDLWTETLTISREIGFQYGIAMSLDCLGMVAREQGDFAAARSMHEESLSIHRSLGNEQRIGYPLHLLGMVAHAQGETAKARELYSRSLQSAGRARDMIGIASNLEQLALLLLDLGQPLKSLHLWSASYAPRAQIEAPMPPRWREKCETYLSKIHSELGDAFPAAWETGRLLTWEKAIDYALDKGTDDVTGVFSPAGHRAGRAE